MSDDTYAQVARPTRLFKYLAERTVWGHRELGRLSRRGAITVVVGDAPERQISPRELVFEGDLVRVDGRAVGGARPAASEYWALHKPAGVISTAADTSGRPDLSRWLDGLSGRVFPVGRLDRETTGLLLLTDDGDLAHMLLHPDFHAIKRYVITARGDVTPDDARLAMMREGVDIGAKDGRVARAVSVEVAARGQDASTLHMELDEGRKRQVRRMCRAAELWLTHLHRDRFGPVELGEVVEGDARRLAPHEVDALWESVGGRGLPGRRATEALVRHAAFLRERGEPSARLEAWLGARGLRVD